MRPRPIQARHRMPNVKLAVVSFHKLSCLALCYLPSDGKHVSIYDQTENHIVAASFHWLSFGHIHVWVNLQTVPAYLIENQTSHYIYQAWRQLHWSESGGYQHLRVYLFLDETLQFEVKDVDLIGPWLQVVNGVLILMSIPGTHIRLIPHIFYLNTLHLTLLGYQFIHFCEGINLLLKLL